VTELQLTACVFGSTSAFHLIAEGLTVCLFSGDFVRLTVLPLQVFEVSLTHPIFNKLRPRLPNAFHYLVPNDNLHCQTPLKNAKFDLFRSEKMPVGKSGCE